MNDEAEQIARGQNNPVSEELVEAFGLVLCQTALGSKQCPCAETGFVCANDHPGNMARAILTSPAYLAELQAAWRRGMEEAVGIADYFGSNSAGARSVSKVIRSRMEKKS